MKALIPIFLILSTAGCGNQNSKQEIAKLEDKKWLTTNGENLFRELLECDGWRPEEEQKFHQLMPYIKSALPN